MTVPADAEGALRPVVVSGGQVFTAGQVGFDADGTVVDGGIGAQTRQALTNMRACVEAIARIP